MIEYYVALKIMILNTKKVMRVFNFKSRDKKAFNYIKPSHATTD